MQKRNSIRVSNSVFDSKLIKNKGLSHNEQVKQGAVLYILFKKEGQSEQRTDQVEQGMICNTSAPSTQKETLSQSYNVIRAFYELR